MHKFGQKSIINLIIILTLITNAMQPGTQNQEFL